MDRPEPDLATDEPVATREQTATGQTIGLSARDVNSDLTCPVCLSVINETWTVKECMHRFCQNCIENALRYGSKQCPACRVPVPSRRSLRADKTFDAIISRFHPDLAKQEEEHERFVQDVIQAHNHKAFAASVLKGVTKQSLVRKKKGRISIAPEPVEDSIGIYKRPPRRRAGRRVIKPVTVCLQRHESSVDCGPRVRMFVDVPRTVCLSQITDHVRSYLPPTVQHLHFYGVKKPIALLAATSDDSNSVGNNDADDGASSVAGSVVVPAVEDAVLERIDVRNKFDDLDYYFNTGTNNELLLVYTNADAP